MRIQKFFDLFLSSEVNQNSGEKFERWFLFSLIRCALNKLLVQIYLVLLSLNSTFKEQNCIFAFSFVEYLNLYDQKE